MHFMHFRLVLTDNVLGDDELFAFFVFDDAASTEEFIFIDGYKGKLP